MQRVEGIMKKVKRSKLSLKLFLYVLCATAIVLVFVVATFFFFYRRQMEDKYRRLTYNTLSNVDVVFDGYIDIASNMAIQFHQSSDGVLSRYSADYNIAENMAFLNYIRDTISYAPYIQSVAFLNREKKISLYVSSGISYVADYERVMEEQMTESEGEWLFVWSAPNHYRKEPDIPMLTCLCSDAPIDNPNYGGTTAVTIDMRMLSKYLFAHRIEGDMTIFILDRHGNVVAHSDEEYCGENWADRELVKRVREGENQFKVAVDSRDYEVNWISSAQRDFTVVAQTRFNNVNGEIFMIMIILAAFVLLVCLFILVIRKILRPLTEVVQDMEISAIDEIGGSNVEGRYDEIEFLRRYHVGMNNQMEILRKQLYKNLILRNLIVGAGKDVVWPMLEESGLAKFGRRYFLVLIYLQKKTGYTESLPDYTEAKNRICEICGFDFEEMGHPEIFDVSLRRVLFLLGDEDGKEIVQGRLLEALQKKKQEIDLSLQSFETVMVLSEEITEERDICRIYRNMNSRLNNRLFLGEIQGVSVGPAMEEKMTGEDPGTPIQALRQSVVSREHDRYLVAVAELLCTCKDFTHERFCDVLMEVWHVIYDIRKDNLTADRKNRFQESAREQIQSMQTRSELMEWFEQLYTMVELQITQIRDHSASATLVDVVDFIQNNYGKYELNVNFLADRMHLSVQHFSRIFREFTGNTVGEYITKVRMEKARELLTLFPDMDMTEIAESLGYGSSAYFGQVFRKYYGTSPAKYRDYHAMSRMEESNKK